MALVISGESVEMFRNINTILASVVAATGLTSLKLLLDGNLSMRPILGGFIVGTGLLIISFFAVEIAVGLALMILLASVLNNGVPVLEKVMRFAD
jgi:hypothetical protein